MWTILEPLCYVSYATLVYGELGFIYFVDNSRMRTELNRTPIGDESIIHVNHTSKLYMAPKALSSQPRVAHVLNDLEPFIASKALSS